MVSTTNSSTAVCPRSRSTISQDQPTQNGFTIPEMLAVVAIIVIILSMLLPSLVGGRKAAWLAECASNQHQIRSIIQGNKMLDDYSSLPGAGRWVYVAYERGARDVLRCPVGEGEYVVDYAAGTDPEYNAPPEVSQQFDQLYSVQVAGNNLTFSYVTDIMNGQLASDPQLGRQWKGGFLGVFGESGNGWPVAAFGPLDPDSHMAVTYDDDGGYVVEFEGEGEATVHSMDAPGDTRCGSDHWVCIGESGANWQGEIVMRLTGNGHQNIVDAPVKVGGLGDFGGGSSGSGNGKGQYGMNNLATDKDHRSGQILLTDYRKTIIRMNTTGTFLDDFDLYFAPRHLGKANVLFVDGSVQIDVARRVEE